jgi:hypothetical protein
MVILDSSNWTNRPMEVFFDPRDFVKAFPAPLHPIIRHHGRKFDTIEIIFNKSYQ